eukprot:gene6896-11058_t
MLKLKLFQKLRTQKWSNKFYSKKTLYEHEDISVTVDTNLTKTPKELLNLFASVKWGTKGGLQFSKKDEEFDKIKVESQGKSNKFHFLELNHKTDGLIGAVILNEFNEEIKRISRYFLVISEKFQGKKLGKLLRKVSSDYTDEIIKEKGYTHTYIETTNERSYNLQIASGMKIIGTVNIILILFLKKKYNYQLDGEFSLIRGDEWDGFYEKFKKYYQDYKMFDAEISVKPESYYVQRDKNGEIIFGGYVKKSEMELIHVPGFLGQTLQFFSFIPTIRNLLKHFKSISISGIYCKKGNEKDLSTFIGKVYENIGFGSNAMIFLDERDPLNDYVNLKGALIVDKSSKIYCFMKSKNLSEKEEKEIEEKLIFPSALEPEAGVDTPNPVITETKDVNTNTPVTEESANTDGLDLDDLISSGSDEESGKDIKSSYASSYMNNQNQNVVQSKSSIEKIGQCVLSKSTELNLKGEGLTVLPESLRECRHVTKLNLSRNNLTSLPAWFGEVFVNLTSLNLSKNGLFHLPKNFAALDKLRDLNLAYNKFEFMPRPVLQLKSAQLLNLSHNVILFIPSDITSMDSLVTLDICVNRLMNLPPEMIKMKNLKQLYVEGNCFLPSEMKFVMKIASTKYNNTQSELTSVSEPSSNEETEMQEFEVDDKEELENWLKDEINLDPDAELDQLLPTPLGSAHKLLSHPDLQEDNDIKQVEATGEEKKDEEDEEDPEGNLAKAKSTRKIQIPTAKEIQDELKEEVVPEEKVAPVVEQQKTPEQSLSPQQQTGSAGTSLKTQKSVLASVKLGLKLNLEKVDQTTVKQPQVKTARRLEREAKRAKERVNLLFEILDSESKYVQFLNVCHDLYFVPLTTGTVYNPKNKKKLLISSENAMTLFPPDLATIIQFNNTLTQNLQDKFKENKTNPMDICIGEVFNKFGPFFKIYSRYMQHYQKSIDNVMALQAKNAEFSRWLKSNQKKSQSNGLSLKSLLIMPVQRIPRYTLLLSSLIKNTEKDHPDFKKLCDALIEMESIAEFQDKKINEATNKVIVKEIAEKLKISLFQPHRKFVREGKAKVNARKCDIHLFNDLIVLTYREGFQKKSLKYELLAANIKTIKENVILLFPSGTIDPILNFQFPTERVALTWTSEIEKSIGDSKRIHGIRESDIRNNNVKVPSNEVEKIDLSMDMPSARK